MTPEQLQQLISRGETLEVEFKGGLWAPANKPRIDRTDSTLEFTPQAYVQNC